MATTSLVGERDMEKGFEGSLIVEGAMEGEEVWWMWSVESQEADIRRECVGL